MSNNIDYDEFYNEVRRILYDLLKSHESIEDVDRYLHTEEAIREIREKYNMANNGGNDGTDTNIERLFGHYTSSAAGCLNLMYE